jgi:hypothetical protein
MGEIHYTTLAASLQGIPDPRDERGQCYDWLYILEIMAVALMAGQRQVRAMAQWAVEHQAELVACLQPRRKRVPSAATLRRALSKAPIEELECRVSQYSEQVDKEERGVGETVTQAGTRLRGQAVDGKTGPRGLPGASHYGETEHLTSLVRHESGAVLAQTATTVIVAIHPDQPQFLAGATQSGEEQACAIAVLHRSRGDDDRQQPIQCVDQ